MNKLLVKLMYLVGVISFGGALVQGELTLFVGSLTFTLGLFILIAGYIKPIRLFGFLNLASIVSLTLCVCCFAFLPIADAVLLTVWVAFSAAISVEKVEFKYE